MHGPCGDDNRNCPCMKNGMCSKRFPKKFQQETTIDERGFVMYRRRDTGRYVIKNGVKLDNRYVVPYNMLLLKKYQAHINVEFCNQSNIVKYLFKYVTKGPDQANVIFQKSGKRKAVSDNYFLVNKKLRSMDESGTSYSRDEIMEYIQYRYICDKEAYLRILGYELHDKVPAVERFAVHLPNMNTVTYPGRANLASLISTSFLQKTTLTEWFVANQNYPAARELTYCDFPTKWTWNSSARFWKPRGNGSYKIGRMYNIHPSQGENYYLRMLLMVTKGAQCYEDVRTVDGTLYDTFKEACSARGLLGDDREWFSAFSEADCWATGFQLRSLFVLMVMHCGVSDEGALFDKCWRSMSADIEYVLQKRMGNPLYFISDSQLKSLVIDELSQLFSKNGISISK
ncbi:unnamed protein product, partial [Urochloa humidicola]